MSRNAILGTLAGGLMLAIGAISAEAAPLPKVAAASEASDASLVEKAGYRHRRHHYWHYYGPHYWHHHHHRRHHHHYRHHHHRHHYHHHYRRYW